MIHTIQSGHLEVSIKQVGMELSSIKNKQTDTEYLWQGDPQYWSGQAPILFPIIGLLKENSTIINGKEYAIPKHGFVRHSSKTVVVHKEIDKIGFQLNWDEELLQVFPFKFQFEVTFQVTGKKLNIAHTIRNLGDTELLYNLGGHPAFNCPLTEDEEYTDYSIQFEYPETEESWLLNDDGLITDHSIPMLENNSTLRLHRSLFDDDALIFRNLKSNHATLTSDITGDILRVDFHEFPYLGIWAKPNAPFVCIEPWHGIADVESSNRQFLMKEKLRHIKPGEEESLSYSITILQ